MPKSTKYADCIAYAESGQNRVERLFVKGEKQEEIRFSWWKNGNFVPRPLDLPEHELLPLLREGMKQNVFSKDFLDDLEKALIAHRTGT